VYSKYEYTVKATKKSRNNKELIIFICINTIKQFSKSTHKTSFIKASLSTFKGVSTTLKSIEHVLNINLVPTIKLLQDDIKQPLTGSEKLLERSSLKTYNTFFNKNVLDLKFYTNTIIYNSVLLFKKNTESIITRNSNFMGVN